MLLLQDFHRKGGYRSQWVRRMTVWKWFAQYFPITLYKTAELPPDRSYLFGYHPHGVISIGAFAAFATEACGFEEKFPSNDAGVVFATADILINMCVLCC
jgi:2-acylglycerol O-acyltransferase 2